MPRKRRRRSREPSRGYGKLLLGIFIGMALITGLGVYGVDLEKIYSGNEPEETISFNVNSSESLYFAVNDVEFLNRIFRERGHEVAYCGYVMEVEKTWLEPWLADTINSSPHSIQFSIGNCQGNAGALTATIHTHPSGNPELSQRDRATLTTQKQNAMCIQSGKISTQVGDPAEDLTCYETGNLNGKVQISEVPVVIGDRPETGDTWG